MRIISGKAKGTNLYTLKGNQTRPTTDRAKEALFNILGVQIVGTKVLDLFAGSGAIGLEAASRGAETVILSDKSLNKNVAILPTCKAVTFLCKGAFSSTNVKTELKSLIPFADNVLMGPADILFTLIPSFPKLAARYLTLASSAAFATPITLYPSSTFVEP